MLKIVRAVLHHVHEGRKDPAQLGLVHLGTFVLLFLSGPYLKREEGKEVEEESHQTQLGSALTRSTGERDFSVALNAPLTSKSLLDLPPLHQGTHADELVLVIYR